ncbi:MAG: ACP S-malonyltransferase [Longimicrobiales bacterium]
MNLALIFPGQGSQHVGMGQDLAEAFPVARATFEEADDAVGFGLTSLMWEGPEEALTETQNAQPALFAHSLATYRVIQESLGTVNAVAGHSLGELSALAAAGAFAFADGLRAARRRGELMAQAGKETPGTMAAVLGLTSAQVEPICEEGQAEGHIVVPANFNSEKQIVLSGDVPGVHWAMEAAKAQGAKRVVELNVSGAFHSPLMAPAAEGLAECLAGFEIRSPSVPVISTVTGEAVAEGDLVRSLLVQQLTAPVRWKEVIDRMVADDVHTFLEVGPGRVLTGLNKRNAPGKDSRAVNTADSIRALETAA